MFGVWNFVKNLIFTQEYEEDDDIKALEEEFWKDLENKRKGLLERLQVEEIRSINDSKGLDVDSDIDSDESDEIQYSEIKLGLITAVKKDGGVINNCYLCRSQDVLPHVVQVGDKVHFRTVNTEDDEDIVLFVKVEKIVPKDVGKVLDVIQPGDLLGKRYDLGKKINGKITNKTKTCLVIDHFQTINLNTVQCDLILEIGDSVTVECLINPMSGDIVECKHIKPLNRRLLSDCVISHYSEDMGVGLATCSMKNEAINIEIPFCKTVCKPGYLPALNDEIHVEFIESDQTSFQWRAINIDVKKRAENHAPTGESDTSNTATLEGLTIKTVSENTFDERAGLGLVKLEIRNVSHLEHTLVKVRIDNQSRNSGHLISQLRIVRPHNRAYTKLPAIIFPNNYLTFTLEVNTKFYGKSVEKVTFTFNDDVEVKVPVEFQVITGGMLSDKKHNQGPHRYHKKKQYTSEDFHFQDSLQEVVRGVRPTESAMKFRAVRFGAHNIPERLIVACLGSKHEPRIKNSQMVTNLRENYGVLFEQLSEDNYLSKFHTCLFLEEICLISHMANLDIKKGVLRHAGEYLALYILGLMEARPSLIIGDRVYASVPDDVNLKEKRTYEGYIHCIRSEELYIKFSEEFHQTYKGESYSFRFVHSRTQFQRLHHVLDGISYKLGIDWLFPRTIQEKAPVVEILGEEEDTTRPEYLNSKPELLNDKLKRLFPGAEGMNGDQNGLDKKLEIDKKEDNGNTQHTMNEVNGREETDQIITNGLLEHTKPICDRIDAMNVENSIENYNANVEKLSNKILRSPEKVGGTKSDAFVRDIENKHLEGEEVDEDGLAEKVDLYYNRLLNGQTNSQQKKFISPPRSGLKPNQAKNGTCNGSHGHITIELDEKADAIVSNGNHDDNMVIADKVNQDNRESNLDERLDAIVSNGNHDDNMAIADKVKQDSRESNLDERLDAIVSNGNHDDNMAIADKVKQDSRESNLDERLDAIVSNGNHDDNMAIADKVKQDSRESNLDERLDAIVSNGNHDDNMAIADKVKQDSRESNLDERLDAIVSNGNHDDNMAIADKVKQDSRESNLDERLDAIVSNGNHDDNMAIADKVKQDSRESNLDERLDAIVSNGNHDDIMAIADKVKQDSRESNLDERLDAIVSNGNHDDNMAIADKVKQDSRESNLDERLDAIVSNGNHDDNMAIADEVKQDSRESNLDERPDAIVSVSNDITAIAEKDNIASNSRAPAKYKVSQELNWGKAKRDSEINWVRDFAGMGSNRYNLDRSLTRIPLRAKEIKWFNKDLNWHQKAAVRNILKFQARPLPYIIFGPPGTGKTVTVTETVLQIYKLIPEARILLATPNNSSADLLTEKLIESGQFEIGDLVRVLGFTYLQTGSVPDKITPYCCLVNNKHLDDYTTTIENTGGVTRQSRESLLKHRLLISTCTSIGQLITLGTPAGYFTHCIIDEAGQATEPEALIPISLLHKENGHVVLAGDPLQLGPCVFSKLGQQLELATSLLERLTSRFLYARDVTRFFDTGGYDPRLVTRLVDNYRTMPEILKIASDLFYDSSLIPHVSLDDYEGLVLRNLSRMLPERESHPCPILFHGVQGENMQDKDSPSWYNNTEALVVISYLKKLYLAGLNADQVGIITPYRKQVQKIRNIIAGCQMPEPKIASIEEFQGQERLVIIVSTVRSLSSSRFLPKDIDQMLGFIGLPTRLNVAITRARALLMIVGDPNLLCEDLYWEKIIAYVQGIGGYTGCVPCNPKLSC